MIVVNNANTYLPPSPLAPMFLLITNITNARFAVVTVSTVNTYSVGQLFHFSVPNDYGMTQIDNLYGKILTVDATNLIFTTDIDSSFFDVFVIPSATKERPATVACAGSRNLTLTNFNNISVPFHTIDGSVGN